MTDWSVIIGDYQHMSPRADVSEERRNQILSAAEDVFAAKGLDDARMEDIADRTGLSKGTLYNYFKNKEDLIIAIFNRIFGGLFQQHSSDKPEQVSAEESIRVFTDQAIKSYIRILNILPLAYEFLSLAFRNTIVRNALSHYLDHYLDILQQIIQAGIDSGEFRDVDPAEAALAAGAIFEGTILLWMYDKNRVDPEVHIRSGINMLLNGILLTSGR